jgi:hypothetical protein
MVDTPVGTTKGGSNQGVSPGQPQRPDAEHELGKGAYPDYKGGGANPNAPPKSGNPLDVPSPMQMMYFGIEGLDGRGSYRVAVSILKALSRRPLPRFSETTIRPTHMGRIRTTMIRLTPIW